MESINWVCLERKDWVYTKGFAKSYGLIKVSFINFEKLLFLFLNILIQNHT